MAAPTRDQFKARFPVFADVDGAVIDAALAEAGSRVNDTWIAADYDTAYMLYAAHVLTLDGHGSSNEAQLSGFKSLGIGSLRLDMAQDKPTGGITTTSYGRRFKDIQRRNFPGILAV